MIIFAYHAVESFLFGASRNFHPRQADHIFDRIRGYVAGINNLELGIAVFSGDLHDRITDMPGEQFTRGEGLYVGEIGCFSAKTLPDDVVGIVIRSEPKNCYSRKVFLSHDFFDVSIFRKRSR